jgi:hypothetical protein
MNEIVFETVFKALLLLLSICGVALVLVGAYSTYKHVIGEDPASEYRALCIKNEGKPVFNGRHWECMK